MNEEQDNSEVKVEYQACTLCGVSEPKDALDKGVCKDCLSSESAITVGDVSKERAKRKFKETEATKKRNRESSDSLKSYYKEVAPGDTHRLIGGMYIIFVFAISIYYFILAIVFLNKRHSFDTFPSEGFLLFTDYLFKSCLLGCLGLVAWALLHIWNFSEHRRFKDTQYRG